MSDEEHYALPLLGLTQQLRHTLYWIQNMLKIKMY